MKKWKGRPYWTEGKPAVEPDKRTKEDSNPSRGIRGGMLGKITKGTWESLL